MRGSVLTVVLVLGIVGYGVAAPARPIGLPLPSHDRPAVERVYYGGTLEPIVVTAPAAEKTWYGGVLDPIVVSAPAPSAALCEPVRAAATRLKRQTRSAAL